MTYQFAQQRFQIDSYTVSWEKFQELLQVDFECGQVGDIGPAKRWPKERP